MGRIEYYRRIFSAYLGKNTSQLSFWHGKPEINANFKPGRIGEYFMPFIAKADYAGYFDDNGIPLLDYRGTIGQQYNPIAIAQYGLGNYNLYRRTGEESRKHKFLTVANWLVENLEKTSFGTYVWCHHFDWDYRDKLKAPWHSALAQGQGLSLLVRAHTETREDRYRDAADNVFNTFKKDIRNGGVTYSDDNGYLWFEEAIVSPPTHILNGFIWAVWGIYDYFILSGKNDAERLFKASVKTIKEHLALFDIGFWSLYEQSGTRMKMLASPFYHELHIVQLKIMYKLTNESVFQYFADRWDTYRKNPLKRSAAFIYKAAFKLFYY